MLARLARERCVTIPVGMVRLSCNRHSPELFSFDCVDSCILLRIVPCFSNGSSKCRLARQIPDGEQHEQTHEKHDEERCRECPSLPRSCTRGDVHSDTVPFCSSLNIVRREACPFY